MISVVMLYKSGLSLAWRLQHSGSITLFLATKDVQQHVKAAFGFFGGQ